MEDKGPCSRDDVLQKLQPLSTGVCSWWKSSKDSGVELLPMDIHMPSGHKVIQLAWFHYKLHFRSVDMLLRLIRFSVFVHFGWKRMQTLA